MWHGANDIETLRHSAAVFCAHAFSECLGKPLKRVGLSGPSEIAVSAIRNVRLLALAASRIVDAEGV